MGRDMGDEMGLSDSIRTALMEELLLLKREIAKLQEELAALKEQLVPIPRVYPEDYL